MTDLLGVWFTGLNWFVLAYFLVLNTIYLALTVTAAGDIARTLRRVSVAGYDDIFANPLTPAVSIVVPAHNEEAGIVASVEALLDLRYPEFEVVVIDDGSHDDTFEVLRAAFDLVPSTRVLEDDVRVLGRPTGVFTAGGGRPLVVVRKPGTGRRSDAVNVGINAARHPLICMIDADSLLDEESMLRVAKPFVDDPVRMVATGGVIRPANDLPVERGRVVDVHMPRRWLARIQVVEYLRSFLLGRSGWGRFGGLVIISGAFGLFRRDILVEVGGMDLDCIGEDAELVVRIHHHLRREGRPYRMAFLPEPVCWTEVPGDLGALGRQRRRWSRGLAEVLWKHRAMMGNPRYGRIGLVVLPYYLAFELLGPVVELGGLLTVALGWQLGMVDAGFAVLFAAAAFGYGLLLSVAALAVEEFSFHRHRRWRDLGLGLVASLLENVGYRQLHAWWRLRGLASFAGGRSMSWGAMARTGFAVAPPQALPPQAMPSQALPSTAASPVPTVPTQAAAPGPPRNPR